MLQYFPANPGCALDPKCRWVDLLDPSDDEVRLVRDIFGINVPALAAIREIEASSRLRVEGDTLYMSAPMIAGTATNRWQVAPTAFILSPSVCVTVRFSALGAFDTVIEELGGEPELSSMAVLIRLLEEIVDRAADHLERASATVAQASQAVFFDDPGSRGLRKDTALLRDVMRKIGQASDRASRVRYMFLSVGRIASYVMERSKPRPDGNIRDRLEAVRHDITSLDEFEVSLSSRVQLMLDAATGFINIEQNDVVKVLTVASVVGVPPVLVVGVYGMNFRHMPELTWTMGYPLALALCVASAVVPWLWFKWRGWL
ncbi:MAG: magnesium transporter CorA family protein [Dokdonella sp.]